MLPGDGKSKSILFLANAAAVPRATALRRCESEPAACYASPQSPRRNLNVSPSYVADVLKDASPVLRLTKRCRSFSLTPLDISRDHGESENNCSAANLSPLASKYQFSGSFARRALSRLRCCSFRRSRPESDPSAGQSNSSSMLRYLRIMSFHA